MKKVMACGLTLLIAAALIFSSFTALAFISPHERYGIAYIDASPAGNGKQITAWIDGAQFGSNVTYNGDGSISIETMGDDESQTVCKYGGLNGDEITYWLDNSGDGMPDTIANENSVFTSGAIVNEDLNFATGSQPDMGVKINELVAAPSSGNDYIYIDTVDGTLTLADWRLEDHDAFSATLDTLTTEYHQTDATMLAVDLGGDILDATADELILSWNPGTTGINENNWTAMDRVEYGYQTTKPDNTTLVDAPESIGADQGLKRTTNGSDTNDCDVDFSLGTATAWPVTTE
ncbi:MAG: hypothetical protein R6U61_03005, partial [Thermoplasmata archaeon]